MVIKSFSRAVNQPLVISVINQREWMSLLERVIEAMKLDSFCHIPGELRFAREKEKTELVNGY